MMHDAAYGKAELQWSRRRTSTETRPARSERFLRGPHVGRESPSADELRHAFRVEEMRMGLIHSRRRVGCVAATASGVCDFAPAFRMLLRAA